MLQLSGEIRTERLDQVSSAHSAAIRSVCARVVVVGGWASWSIYTGHARTSRRRRGAVRWNKYTVRIGGQKARRDEQVKRCQKWRHVRRLQRVQLMLLREPLTTGDVVREALTTSDACQS